MENKYMISRTSRRAWAPIAFVDTIEKAEQIAAESSKDRTEYAVYEKIPGGWKMIINTKYKGGKRTK